jgi:hypothetical protein
MEENAAAGHPVSPKALPTHPYSILSEAPPGRPPPPPCMTLTPSACGR